jgi:AcrR family transcriptional regulator
MNESVSPRSPVVNERRREQAKARILDAAHALFTERGYDATTMAEVSRQAGVSAGLTVYYFRTKQHLVQALVDRLLHKRTVQVLRASHGSPQAQLATVIDTLLRTAADEPRIIAMHLALLLQPGVDELLADGEHYWEDQLAEELRKVRVAMERAFPGSPAEEHLLFRARMMGATYGIVSPYLPMPYELTRRRLFAEYQLDWNLGSPPSRS